MKAAWSFLLYELRRHVPNALGSLTLLFVLPLVYLVSKGSWAYWGSGWEEGMALLAAYFLAPVIAFYLASPGWAVERSQGSLRWLYARPLPAAGIVLIRLLAVFAMTAAWTGVALLVNGIWPAKLVAWISQWPLVAAGAWLVGIGLGVGGGSLASALSWSRDAVISVSFVGGLVLLVLVPWLVLGIAPTTAVLLGGGSRHLLTSVLIYLGLVSLALLAGTGYAMRRTPADQARWRRAALAAGPLLIVAGAAFSVLVLQPLRVSPHTSSVRWLGGGTTLRFAGAPGLQPWIQHPVLIDEDGNERVFHRTFALPSLVLAHAGRGRAVVREVGSNLSNRLASSRWMVLDREGEVKRLDFAEYGIVEPIGFSPQGNRFAWKESYRDWEEAPELPRMAVMDDELQVVWLSLEVPTPEYTATWIDDERLLVVPAMPHYRPSGHGWWMIVNADGTTELGPQTLPQGASLYSPAFAYPLEFYLGIKSNGPDQPTFSPAPLARRDSEPVLFLRRCEEDLSPLVTIDNQDVSQLVALDTRTGELQPLPETLRSTPSACGPPPQGGFVGAGLVSLGPLADSGLVWAEPVPVSEPAAWSETRILRMRADSFEPQHVCTFRSGHREVGGYRGTIGSWALWSDSFEQRLFACQVETGEVRTLALQELGGARAVDIVDGGVLTATGIIELN